MNTNSIRSAFIDYFTKCDHTHIKSSSLIPHNDPSLMFVNSGMVQFKNVFTSLETRSYNKAVTAQKCVRAGGKHNDLDNVGYTARHHTFFEMLGNFSFGDYFKEQAIFYAWDLLTKVFGLDRNRLWVTVYHTDTEAYDLWKKIAGLSNERIIKISTQDNFWSMGDTGPCGPCSEVFYDYGDKVFGGLPGTKDEDGDRYVEIWNMVFMQFEQISKDLTIPLKKKSIDTGMGLERIASVLQGKLDNYDIDIFHKIIEAIQKHTGVTDTNTKPYYKVISDHLRSCCFLIADGVMPSNEGRGYVLRRIMRRAMRYVHYLGSKEPLMHKLVPSLIENMEHYPELSRAQNLITNILYNEEEKFCSMLDRGIKILNEEVASLKDSQVLSGAVAFKLYDTYGFPLDLTQNILQDSNIEVNQLEFEEHMTKQKENARKSWTGSGENANLNIWFEIKEKYGATEFLGYSLDTVDAKVLAIIHNNKIVDKYTYNQAKDSDAKNTENDNHITLITNQTSFYGEAGGQKGDIGHIYTKVGDDFVKIKVIDTQKYCDIIAHICVMESGTVKKDMNLTLEIDTVYRNNLRMHHSATHILHAVMRKILGDHVIQKGSLVSHNKLRFDVTHHKSITLSELKEIETKINEIIIKNTDVTTQVMQSDEAVSQGAIALFGEKYEDHVRVVSMDSKYSFELCGGTHVKRTGDIGLFKITSESSVASNIRRIEAVCGLYALEYTQKQQELLLSVANTLNTNTKELQSRASHLLEENKVLQNRIKSLEMNSLKISSTNSKKFIYQKVNETDPKTLRSAIMSNIKTHPQIAILYTYKLDDISYALLGVGNESKMLDENNNLVPADASYILTYIKSEIPSTKGGGNKQVIQFNYRYENNKHMLQLIEKVLDK